MKMIKARPTTYKGIRMRSRLEAYFAAMLDDVFEAAWEYEPVCFAGPSGQWLPDFKIDLMGGHPEYLQYAEVKPWVMAPLPYGPFDRDWQESWERQNAVDAILLKMETAWLSSSTPLALYFADVQGGKIARYLEINCEAPGDPWCFGSGDCAPEIERCGELYPGLGQETARMEAEEAALRQHSLNRMRAMGVKTGGVPR
jgi:hypothetical protein